MIIFEVMIKSIRNFLIIFFISQQLKSQISKFDKNWLIGFCEQTLHLQMLKPVLVNSENKNSLMGFIIELYEF